MSATRDRISGRIVLSMMIWMALSAMSWGQAELPKVFKDYIKPNQDYVAERGVVLPPEGMDKYTDLVTQGAAKNPEWYREYSAAAKPGVPLPYHKNLNLTPQEYQEYLELWAKRKFTALEKVDLRMEQRNGQWRVLVGGAAATAISLLQYEEEKDSFRSTNGLMKRIDDVAVSAETLLGEWTGVEWRYDEETIVGIVKENLAFGKSADGKFCYLIYRLQDVTKTGRTLKDQNVLIRFSKG